ncbi:DUF6316 family protein [Aliikangiella maris]|uniref:DUF6316 family protein n=2 Tax=Aliikangiella maris TaxID=3162458 RepID=A0ABV2BR50_9GAMM
MYQTRAEDANITDLFSRSNRFVKQDGELFYRTREGELHGPFSTESSALFDLNIFLEVVEIEKQIHSDYGVQLAWG